MWSASVLSRLSRNTQMAGRSPGRASRLVQKGGVTADEQRYLDEQASHSCLLKGTLHSDRGTRSPIVFRVVEEPYVIFIMLM
ncbi:hypothetical protein DPEC_G00100940 [Dallia pectoralis]|uniref:Uncharacterized protein n=1 Tax=Dallia pectoralis TaxID=75939 RepID=A0ACC2GWC0_DALPE|nr:hypothetical protein DPEC_G00100940 [Dallia pectoralis]